MLTRMNQRGEGKLGCVMGLLFLAVAVFLAYKIIPVKVRGAEFRDAVHDNARAAGTMSQDAIKDAIAYKALQLKIPVEKKDVKIQRTADSITVKVEYEVPIEFPGYVYTWSDKIDATYPVF